MGDSSVWEPGAEETLQGQGRGGGSRGPWSCHRHDRHGLNGYLQDEKGKGKKVHNHREELEQQTQRAAETKKKSLNLGNLCATPSRLCRKKKTLLLDRKQAFPNL